MSAVHVNEGKVCAGRAPAPAGGRQNRTQNTLKRHTHSRLLLSFAGGVSHQHSTPTRNRTRNCQRNTTVTTLDATPRFRRRANDIRPHAAPQRPRAVLVHTHTRSPRSYSTHASDHSSHCPVYLFHSVPNTVRSSAQPADPWMLTAVGTANPPLAYPRCRWLCLPSGARRDATHQKPRRTRGRGTLSRQLVDGECVRSVRHCERLGGAGRCRCQAFEEALDRHTSALGKVMDDAEGEPPLALRWTAW